MNPSLVMALIATGALTLPTWSKPTLRFADARASLDGVDRHASG